VERNPTGDATSSDEINGQNAGDGHIVLERIGKAYDGVEVLPDLDLAINRGEFFVLLGPSGCGKSTTLRIIAGLEAPTRGRTLLDGKDVTRTPSSRRNVNMVFQSHALFPHLTVWGNVAFGLQVKRVSRPEIERRVREALHTVRLQGVEDRRPAELSGGQQQRVALARALVNRPAALLLDEPLGALDLALRREMQRELKDIQVQTGTTFVYVTHDQEEAMVMADRVAVMRAGLLEQVGTPRELYDAPASTFVAGFVGASNILAGPAKPLGEGLVSVAIGDGHEILAPAPQTHSAHAHVLVRPERVSLGPVEQPASRLAGTVTQKTFMGQFMEYRVRVSNSVEIVIHDAGGRDGDPEVGDRAELQWRAGDGVLLDETRTTP